MRTTISCAVIFGAGSFRSCKLVTLMKLSSDLVFVFFLLYQLLLLFCPFSRCLQIIYSPEVLVIFLKKILTHAQRPLLSKKGMIFKLRKCFTCTCYSVASYLLCYILIAHWSYKAYSLFHFETGTTTTVFNLSDNLHG